MDWIRGARAKAARRRATRPEARSRLRPAAAPLGAAEGPDTRAARSAMPSPQLRGRQGVGQLLLLHSAAGRAGTPAEEARERSVASTPGRQRQHQWVASAAGAVLVGPREDQRSRRLPRSRLGSVGAGRPQHCPAGRAGSPISTFTPRGGPAPGYCRRWRRTRWPQAPRVLEIARSARSRKSSVRARLAGGHAEGELTATPAGARRAGAAANRSSLDSVR